MQWQPMSEFSFDMLTKENEHLFVLWDGAPVAPVWFEMPRGLEDYPNGRWMDAACADFGGEIMPTHFCFIDPPEQELKNAK